MKQPKIKTDAGRALVSALRQIVKATMVATNDEATRLECLVIACALSRLSKVIIYGPAARRH